MKVAHQKMQDTISTDTDTTDDASDMEVDHINWHVSLNGYWDNIDERFYGEDTPNDPPIINVPEKLAADIEYINSPLKASIIAEKLDMDKCISYNSAVKIRFNDFSTWHWPMKSCDREFTYQLKGFIDRWFPDIIQWHAIVRGDDPKEALERWYDEIEPSTPDWIEEFEDTDMDEETRQYLNDNADWLPEISRTVEGKGVDSSSDISIEEDWNEGW
jgi:hypothetical protein